MLLLAGIAASSPAATGGPKLNVGEGQQEGTIRYKVSGSTPGANTAGTSAPAVAVHNSATAGGSPAPASSLSSAPLVDCPAEYSTYKPCPGTVKPTTAPAPIPPSTVAATYWAQAGTNQLPSPHPYIAPGYAIAGLPGYLEVQAPLTTTFSDPTKLGALTFHATAVVWVNWGDGSSDSGPYHSAGAPYPNGTITHYWDDDGAYDIVVSEDWTATWSLAGASGTLTGLQTVGSIPDFEVGQVESVRNY